MVHHALYQKQNYSYAGIIEALSGAPFDVKFISFDDILKDKDILKDIDVIINVGDGDNCILPDCPAGVCRIPVPDIDNDINIL